MVLRTDEGLVAFDTSYESWGQLCVDAIRGWSQDRFNTIVFIYGHTDHVGGCGAFCADCLHQTPRIVGHENVLSRF
mgnify:CR=1 FL=1